MPELAARPPSEHPPAPAPPGAPNHQYTVEEYLAFERMSPTKSEYFAGNIYAMTGASRRHVLIVTNLIRSLGNRLADRPCEVYGTDMRVKVNATGLYTYPDVSVVCSEPRFDEAAVDTLLNPQVVLEVLSSSTNSYDRFGKFDHYRQVDSLTDYVLVAQDACYIEHRRRQSDGEWSVVELTRLDESVPLASVECELPLNEIYRRINFPA